MSASCQTYLDRINEPAIQDQLINYYGEACLGKQSKRYEALLSKGLEYLGDSPVFIATSPGRTELGGNHTDHNHGMVLAAAIDKDCVSVTCPTDNDKVEILSAGFSPINVNLDDLEPRENEYGTPEGIIRGVAAGLHAKDVAIKGFKAILDTDIPIGCGLSSSASFEVLTGSIFAKLANYELSPLDNAIIGQKAENIYFGKPCGLMDQTACANRGIIHIDFEKPEDPQLKNLFVNFQDNGYQLVIINTGGDHRDLTDEYTAITDEMADVARFFGKGFGRELITEDILSNLPELRAKTGDRAVLRMLHFMEENKRVAEMVKALELQNFNDYFRLVRESGKSSYQLLQNCMTTGATKIQPIALALALSDHFLAGKGASRVHGGGFAGTIQAYVPTDIFPEYYKFMSKNFGDTNVFPIRIRPEGNAFIEL